MPLKAEIASEYFNYKSKGEKQPLGVLISQSGRSSEVLWCRELFDEYMAIVNAPVSPLTRTPNVKAVVMVMGGPEESSSTKSYFNTLLALYRGFGIDPTPAVDVVEKRMADYEAFGKETASKLVPRIKSGKVNGIYIVGSGPNIATAYQGALIMGETTKLPVTGMPMAQYDHGPKETAKNSVIIAINVKGPSYERTNNLIEVITKAGAEVVLIEDTDLEEGLTPLTTIMPINFLTHYLAEALGVDGTFVVGSKVTEVR